MVERDVERKIAPVAPADERRAGDAELRQKLDGVLRHGVVVERALRIIGGLPVPHLIGRDDVEARRKERDHLGPAERGARGPALQEDERRPAPLSHVVHL